ncbi:hypothetical protein SK128_011360 [Halocaridina rubra]|uniref:Amino acid permease/ SLC12A domain-containing protein n=1 Tax=Halocaridina rubra TaxID=373956 RepID=A0AAN8X2N6_HALRR
MRKQILHHTLHLFHHLFSGIFNQGAKHAVGISLCVTGFGESMTELLHLSWAWSEKAIGSGALLLLALVNIAGVKWVIKVQFVLLLMVMLAALDFIFGSFLDHSEG